ncbi:Helix-turn-helix [Butyrivibrio fibrisolvens DSM 3071]|uniref:Helix-turn-helix n=2 Tax=Butyrivibrio fibrisolvens TaxID=831 RepID=A0A1M6GIM1_BUTFI|nr:helix-turn-helix domain-containing protein [Butyrivibrio fibrisolvens]SHJ09776.1 Helix-turn-helix [Butyrivibrio fibrisolvens DSM 3071]
MSFNYYLRKKLHETKMSQAQLANEIDVTKAMVNRWIKPYSRNPQKKSIQKVVEFFGDDFDELERIFTVEEYWGDFFWKNFRAILLERQTYCEDIPGIDEKVLRRYYTGKCDYVELYDLMLIAKYLNCSVEKLVDCNTIQFGGYNNIELIGSEKRLNNQWGLSIEFNADYKVGTTEMEPTIHIGDQIVLKRDLITRRISILPSIGDVVVLHDKKEKKLYLRRVDNINGQIVYVANNTQFPPILKSEYIEVKGIVAQALTEFNR